MQEFTMPEQINIYRHYAYDNYYDQAACDILYEEGLHEEVMAEAQKEMYEMQIDNEEQINEFEEVSSSLYEQAVHTLIEEYNLEEDVHQKACTHIVEDRPDEFDKDDNYRVKQGLYDGSKY